MLRARYNCLPTADRLKLMKVPWAQSGCCPLCGRPDSAGHLLGACLHKKAQQGVVKRHNLAVKLVQRATRKGSLGAAVMFMDACPATDLPMGVAGTRLPGWLMPCAPGETRQWRPDLLLIAPPARPSPTDTSVLADLHSGNTPSAASLRHAKRHFRVFIMELGFVSESSDHWSDSIKRKAAQQDPLCRALTTAGWRHVSSLAVPVGSAGTIFDPTPASLALLGLASAPCKRLMRALHMLAAHQAHSLLKLRQHLSRTQSRKLSRRRPP